jgi:hypothetical protein
MSTPSPRPAPSPLVSWGIALAAGSMLLIGGGAIVWSSHDPDPTLVQPPADAYVAAGAKEIFVTDGAAIYRRPLPAAEPGPTFHSVAYTVENGTRVVKIKVVETGDELVVDAATGRLLEARPNRSTAPPPVGKFAAPFTPMT